MVSIIVPVYKVEQYIHRCVDSILNQSYSDFELILVDDGSPDGSGVICDVYAEKDNRVRVIHQKNGGPSAARNTGIDWVTTNSNSQWLTFIDSDDWVHRDYLKNLVEAAETHNTLVSMCDLIARDEYSVGDENVPVKYQVKDFINAYTQHYGSCMTPCCKLYHRKLWEKLYFPVGKIHEDAFVTHLPLMAAEQVAVCLCVLYYYFFNENSLTRSKWTEKRLDQIPAHEKRMAYWLELGYEECYLREMTEYINVLCLQLRQIEETGDGKYQHHIVAIRKKLRVALRTARRYGCYPFVEKYWGEYTHAYPNRMTRIAVYCWLKYFRSGTQTKER